jgi:riboflavin synthase
VFTGIITALGRVRRVERRSGGGARITLATPARYGRFAAGESVSVSGVCLTALRPGRSLIADLSAETLRRSHLSALAAGDPVNLERALRFGDRLSGHFVMGHVDGVSRVLRIARKGNSWIYRFSIPPGLSRFVVRKGSVALDGVSLTVAARRPRAFDVAVIPETHRRTTLGRVGPGDLVNFEVDVFARYGWAGSLRRAKGVGRRR